MSGLGHSAVLRTLLLGSLDSGYAVVTAHPSLSLLELRIPASRYSNFR
ncbi:MAG: hypothetical protein OD815_001732 [Candidatus Alkanophagales archaeon MCA70_species_2]|nr:hypothetical protein [Candidatus Alkanophaga liquidiphilum]